MHTHTHTLTHTWMFRSHWVDNLGNYCVYISFIDPEWLPGLILQKMDYWWKCSSKPYSRLPGPVWNICLFHHRGEIYGSGVCLYRLVSTNTMYDLHVKSIQCGWHQPRTLHVSPHLRRKVSEHTGPFTTPLALFPGKKEEVPKVWYWEKQLQLHAPPPLAGTLLPDVGFGELTGEHFVSSWEVSCSETQWIRNSLGQGQRLVRTFLAAHVVIVTPYFFNSALR